MPEGLLPQAVPIAQPAGFVPLHAAAFADGAAKAVTVSQTSPLPVAAAQAFAATSTPLAGAVSDTAAHVFGPFAPQLAREIWATLVGQGASGTAQLLRSTDGGATMAGLTAGGVAWAGWSFSAVSGSIVNEQVASESDAAASYYLAVTLSAGSLTYRIAQ